MRAVCVVNEVELRVAEVWEEEDQLMYLYVEMWLDGELVQEYGERPAIDMLMLERSLVGDGGYFVWTCECGNPGCGGFRDGVDVLHIKHERYGELVWWFEDEMWRHDKKMRRLCLRVDDLRREIEKVKEAGRVLLGEKGELVVCPMQNGYWFRGDARNIEDCLRGGWYGKDYLM